MKAIIYSSLFFLFTACSTCPCSDYAIVGPDQFVTDSYQICQGKIAILAMEGRDIGTPPCDAMEEYRDMIAEDDILNILVYHPTRKDLMEDIDFINSRNGGFRVSNGQVNIPGIPPIHVEGLSLDEARQEMELQFQNHIHDVEVFISYNDRLQRKVELNGVVAHPTIPVDGKIRLYEVLGKARIDPLANLHMSYVVRDGEPLAIDLHRLINQGDMNQNIVMRGGDKVFIANRDDATVTVMGEVTLPTAVSVPYGFISLREALVAARGIPYTGDRRCIQVIRGNIPCPKIYVLSWEHIVHLPNDSLLLMPGDTVYVSEKPITQWNRFIEQLLPTFTGVHTVHKTYKMLAE